MRKGRVTGRRSASQAGAHDLENCCDDRLGQLHIAFCIFSSPQQLCKRTYSRPGLVKTALDYVRERHEPAEVGDIPLRSMLRLTLPGAADIELKVCRNCPSQLIEFGARVLHPEPLKSAGNNKQSQTCSTIFRYRLLEA